MNVLIVEDSELYQHLVGKALEKAGHESEAALDAESAIEKVKTSSYDVAFLDLNLPGGRGGLEIHALLTEMSPDLKIIFMTGDSSPETIEKMESVDAFGYITKPFKLDKIREIVGKCAAAGDKNESTDTEGHHD